MNTESKARSWDAAAELLEQTFGQPHPQLTDEERKHILNAIVPNLRRRAIIIRSKKKKHGQSPECGSVGVLGNTT